VKSTFPLALTFLTCLPWRWTGPAGPQDLARSMFWFPWVGALLGLGYWAAWTILLKYLPGPAVLLALTVAATAGLHLDGLADTFDGLGGGRDAAERLRIMKDSRLGTFGAAALILVLLLKFAFLTALADKGAGGAWAIFLFPVLSRWGMVALAYLSPYARPEGGLGQAMTEGVTPGVLAGATVSALVLAGFTFGWQGPVIQAGAALAAWGLSRFCRKKLGGITGDTLGAANEILETLVLGACLVM
jgi:adenosylcobinamide-GDP ribazoletransferase